MTTAATPQSPLEVALEFSDDVIRLEDEDITRIEALCNSKNACDIAAFTVPIRAFTPNANLVGQVNVGARRHGAPLVSTLVGAEFSGKQAANKPVVIEYTSPDNETHYERVIDGNQFRIVMHFFFAVAYVCMGLDPFESDPALMCDGVSRKITEALANRRFSVAGIEPLMNANGLSYSPVFIETVYADATPTQDRHPFAIRFWLISKRITVRDAIEKLQTLVARRRQRMDTAAAKKQNKQKHSNRKRKRDDNADTEFADDHGVDDPMDTDSGDAIAAAAKAARLSESEDLAETTPRIWETELIALIESLADNGHKPTMAQTIFENTIINGNLDNFADQLFRLRTELTTKTRHTDEIDQAYRAVEAQCRTRDLMEEYKFPSTRNLRERVYLLFDPAIQTTVWIPYGVPCRQYGLGLYFPVLGIKDSPETILAEAKRQFEANPMNVDNFHAAIINLSTVPCIGGPFQHMGIAWLNKLRVKFPGREGKVWGASRPDGFTFPKGSSVHIVGPALVNPWLFQLIPMPHYYDNVTIYKQSIPVLHAELAALNPGAEGQFNRTKHRSRFDLRGDDARVEYETIILSPAILCLVSYGILENANSSMGGYITLAPNRGPQDNDSLARASGEWMPKVPYGTSELCNNAIAVARDITHMRRRELWSYSIQHQSAMPVYIVSIARRVLDIPLRNLLASGEMNKSESSRQNRTKQQRDLNKILQVQEQTEQLNVPYDVWISQNNIFYHLRALFGYFEEQISLATAIKTSTYKGAPDKLKRYRSIAQKIEQNLLTSIFHLHCNTLATIIEDPMRPAVYRNSLSEYFQGYFATFRGFIQQGQSPRETWKSRYQNLTTFSTSSLEFNDYIVNTCDVRVLVSECHLLRIVTITSSEIVPAEKPQITVLILGDSSAGKSYIMRVIMNVTDNPIAIDTFSLSSLNKPGDSSGTTIFFDEFKELYLITEDVEGWFKHWLSTRFLSRSLAETSNSMKNIGLANQRKGTVKSFTGGAIIGAANVPIGKVRPIFRSRTLCISPRSRATTSAMRKSNVHNTFDVPTEMGSDAVPGGADELYRQHCDNATAREQISRFKLQCARQQILQLIIGSTPHFSIQLTRAELIIQDILDNGRLDYTMRTPRNYELIQRLLPARTITYIDRVLCSEVMVDLFTDKRRMNNFNIGYIMRRMAPYLYVPKEAIIEVLTSMTPTIDNCDTHGALNVLKRMIYGNRRARNLPFLVHEYGLDKNKSRIQDRNYVTLETTLADNRDVAAAFVTLLSTDTTEDIGTLALRTVFTTFCTKQCEITPETDQNGPAGVPLLVDEINFAEARNPHRSAFSDIHTETSQHSLDRRVTNGLLGVITQQMNVLPSSDLGDLGIPCKAPTLSGKLSVPFMSYEIRGQVCTFRFFEPELRKALLNIGDPTLEENIKRIFGCSNLEEYPPHIVDIVKKSLAPGVVYPPVNLQGPGFDYLTLDCDTSRITTRLGKAPTMKYLNVIHIERTKNKKFKLGGRTYEYDYNWIEYENACKRQGVDPADPNNLRGIVAFFEVLGLTEKEYVSKCKGKKYPEGLL